MRSARASAWRLSGPVRACITCNGALKAHRSLWLPQVALAVQPIVVPVFGAEWADLGVILLTLMPLIWGATIVSPTNHLVVLNRQGLQLYADILRLGLVCGAIATAAVLGWEFKWAVLAVACSSLLGHSMLFVLQLNVQTRLIQDQSNLGEANAP